MAEQSAVIGARARIDTKSGSYEGIIGATDLHNHRVTLDKVVNCEKNEKIAGRQHFFKSEIVKFTILEEAKDKKTDIQPKGGRSIVVKKQMNSHLNRLRNLQTSHVVLSKQSRNSSGDESAAKDSSDEEDGKAPDTSYHVLVEIDAKFIEAVNYLKSQKIIGFAAEGLNLGRNGKLCWIQMATKEEVILFDMVSLGKEAIEAGIGMILEKGTTQKVIHDCRALSDLFYHQFNVKLINVFDTQVAAAIVQRNETNFFSNYVESLPHSLSVFLNIDNDKLIWTKYREEYKDHDMAVWSERPAAPVTLELAARHVRHLPQLRLVLLEKMLADFTCGVDIYLSILRDASATEIKEYQAKVQPHLMPRQFSYLNQEATSRRQKFADRYVGSKTWVNGFTEICVNRDPTIVFSHDGIWHANDKPIRSYEHCQSRARRSRVVSPRYDSQSDSLQQYMDQGQPVVSLSKSNDAEASKPQETTARSPALDTDNSSVTQVSLQQNAHIKPRLKPKKVSPQCSMNKSPREYSSVHNSPGVRCTTGGLPASHSDPNHSISGINDPNSAMAATVVRRSIADILSQCSDDSDQDSYPTQRSYKLLEEPKPLRCIAAGCESTMGTVKTGWAQASNFILKSDYNYESDGCKTNDEFDCIPATAGATTQLALHKVFTNPNQESDATKAQNECTSSECECTRPRGVKSLSPATPGQPLGRASLLACLKTPPPKPDDSSSEGVSHDSDIEPTIRVARGSKGRGAVISALVAAR